MRLLNRVVSWQSRHMAQIFSGAGWLLAAGGAVILLVSPFILSSQFDPFKNAVPAGILIALAGHLLARGHAARDAAEKTSQVYLDSSVLAYEEARSLLIDGNNDRAIWIAAGRALVHAKELRSRVTEESHLRVLELHELKYRAFFHDLLYDKTPAFFYGVEDQTLPIKKAAALSSAREDRGGRVTTSVIRELSERSLLAVWGAAQWPHGYEDPLSKQFTEVDRSKLGVLFSGLHEYLEHKRQWSSASGKLFPRKLGEGG